MSGNRTYPKEIFEREVTKIAQKIALNNPWYAVAGYVSSGSMNFLIPVTPMSSVEVELLKTEALIKYLICEIQKNHCQ